MLLQGINTFFLFLANLVERRKEDEIKKLSLKMRLGKNIAFQKKSNNLKSL